MINFAKKTHRYLAHIFGETKTKLTMKKIQNETPKYGLKKRDYCESKVIVSLTSYDKRFTTLPLCLKSLLKQTVKPDKIILYLTESDSSSITKQIEQLKQFGIEIKFEKGNIKPHKKYYYAMQKYPDAILITVDDDVIYDKNLIKRLLLIHSKYPKAIVAERARVIEFNKNGFFNYKSWNLARNFSKPSLKLLATGVGGVLYPPHILNTKLLLNVNYITKYISVDDLWLKAVEILSGVPTVTSIKNCSHPRYTEIPSSAQENALSRMNLDKSQNDKYWMQLDKEFDLFSRFIKNKK